MGVKKQKETASVELSRRDILKGAVGIGMAAAAGSALAVFPGVSQAAVVKAPKKWNMETDVIVVGAGLAGLAAATEALEKGASVILLEKRPAQGGSSAVSTGSLLCTGSKLQMQAGIKDSPEDLVRHLLDVNDRLSDVALVKVLANNIGSDIDWLAAHGVQFIPGVYTVMGSPVARALLAKGAGGGLTSPLFSSAKDKGAKILLETKGESLFRDDKGRIVGLSATNRAGKTVTIRAKKGVILASGGFCASKEHMMRFATAFYYYVVASAPGSTGDGISMAWQAGSDFIHMDAILPTPTVEVSSGMLITSYVLDTGAGILVSEEGKRFCNETGGYFKTALDVGDQVQRQKN
jgi:succinate dehydrogenase/fumarate reductase flavoprotein subunit